jgi:hypothetical protein
VESRRTIEVGASCLYAETGLAPMSSLGVVSEDLLASAHCVFLLVRVSISSNPCSLWTSSIKESNQVEREAYLMVLPVRRRIH